mmetsp:Transcript_63277/g.137627  ORF Transcript_63277/g.137627 Transcript_63277/m.137627 type:complete len:221 (+) Transcript_63277:228-890(+)
MSSTTLSVRPSGSCSQRSSTCSPPSLSSPSFPRCSSSPSYHSPSSTTASRSSTAAPRANSSAWNRCRNRLSLPSLVRPSLACPPSRRSARRSVSSAKTTSSSMPTFPPHSCPTLPTAGLGFVSNSSETLPSSVPPPSPYCSGCLLAPLGCLSPTHSTSPPCSTGSSACSHRWRLTWSLWNASGNTRTWRASWKLRGRPRKSRLPTHPPHGPARDGSSSRG